MFSWSTVVESGTPIRLPATKLSWNTEMLNKLRASSASRTPALARYQVYGAAAKMGGSGRTGPVAQQRWTRYRLRLLALTLAAHDARPPAASDPYSPATIHLKSPPGPVTTTRQTGLRRPQRAFHDDGTRVAQSGVIGSSDMLSV